MAKMCYLRLRQTIEQYSALNNKGDTSEDFQNLIILDAWSIIDIINRLRILTSQMPGLKKGEFVTSFQKATKDIEIHRNFVQHLNNEIPKVENTGHSIWGSLSWIYVTPEMNMQKRVNVITIIPGRLAKSKGHPIVNPAGKEIYGPVDHISLSASDTTINLSEMFRVTKKFGERFQSSLEEATEKQKDSNIIDNEILQIHLKE